MMFSYIEIGAGSSAVSARPNFPTTISTSGTEPTNISNCCMTSLLCAIPAWGMDVGIKRNVPSSNGGINSSSIPGNNWVPNTQRELCSTLGPTTLETGDRTRAKPNHANMATVISVVGMDINAMRWYKHHRKIDA